MWIWQTKFKFERHRFLHEISMLENPDYLWQPWQKYSVSTKIAQVQLIREREISHDNFILFCFIANINKFTGLTQFKFFFWYTVKPRKINSWRYIFQIFFFLGLCLGTKGAFTLSDQVRFLISFAPFTLKYKFLFFRHRFQASLEMFQHELISLLTLAIWVWKTWVFMCNSHTGKPRFLKITYRKCSLSIKGLF